MTTAQLVSLAISLAPSLPEAPGDLHEYHWIAAPMGALAEVAEPVLTRQRGNPWTASDDLEASGLLGAGQVVMVPTYADRHGGLKLWYDWDEERRMACVWAVD